jgi:DNA invertase Pin-like site-specific DNA recombinase
MRTVGVATSSQSPHPAHLWKSMGLWPARRPARLWVRPRAPCTAGLMEAARREGWALVILDLGVDTTTPSGEMIANVMATFARFERRLIGQRTKDALAVKKRQGARLGRPLTVGPDVVRRIARERKRKRSLRQIADGLNADGAHGAWWG